MKCSFREVALADVELLRQLSIRTFRHSYEHLNTAENFQAYLIEAFHIEKLEDEIRNPESTFFFVQYSEMVIGYLKVNIGNSQSEEHSEDYMEVERIYLDHPYQGKGIGKRMMDFVFDIARLKEKSKVWLGVWEKNPGAIEFYTKMGFHESGSHIFRFGDEDQIDIIMEIDLD